MPKKLTQLKGPLNGALNVKSTVREHVVYFRTQFFSVLIQYYFGFRLKEPLSLPLTFLYTETFLRPNGFRDDRDSETQRTQTQ